LVNSLSIDEIEVFNTYACDNDELKNLLKNREETIYFPIDINTKTYNLSLERNPIYNPNHRTEYTRIDTDND
jgi:hypothetical protein